jgi:hypothetical protein
MKCCVNIYFLSRKSPINDHTLTLTILYTTPTADITQKKVKINRLKDEMKFLHVKKEKPNNKLYGIYQKAAQEWRNKWYTILDFIKLEIQNYRNDNSHNSKDPDKTT